MIALENIVTLMEENMEDKLLKQLRNKETETKSKRPNIHARLNTQFF